MLYPIRGRHRQSGPMRREAFSRLDAKRDLVEWPFYRTGVLIVMILFKHLHICASYDLPPPFCYLWNTHEDDLSPYCVSCCRQYHGILMQIGYGLIEGLK